MKLKLGSRQTMYIGIVCGLLCAIALFFYMQTVQKNADDARAEALTRYGGEQIEVCVAARDIMPGETVDMSSIMTKLWIADLLPEDAVSSTSDIVGHQVTSTILKGEVISTKRFEDQNRTLDVPAGLTALSVPAKDVQAVGGAILPNMRIDLYATGETSTTLIGESILVLSTSVSSSESAEGASIAWITVAVKPEKVQELVTAAQRLELYFVLPSSEEENSSSAGTQASANHADTNQSAASKTEGE